MILLVLLFLLIVLFILVLLILILRALLLFLLILLLLFLFLQLLQLAFHQIAIVFRIRIGGLELQRGFVGLDRLLPSFDRFLRVRLFRFLAKAILRVAEVVVIVLLQRHIVGLHRFCERFGGLIEDA